MVKLFVTGDIHIGKKYDRYLDVKDKLIQSRFDCLENAVRQAEKESCDFFVITGDLFDKINSIKQEDVRRVVEILAKFNGRVIVLPGNHDYYTGEERVWKDFDKARNGLDHNIVLVTKFEELSFDAGEETITFYPAFCQSKHSEKNNLGWIKARPLDDAAYHVGIAHGAIEGLTPDMKNEYFLMSEDELNGIPMDAWLIGHTHIPYPTGLTEEKDAVGYKIFNPGTPEQTDLSNRTAGWCFIITLDKKNGVTSVAAHSYNSGKVRFFDIHVNADKDGLEKSVRDAVEGLPKNSVIRLTISGAIPESEYSERNSVYEALLGSFLTYEVDDTGLCEQISAEKIRSEFAEIGFAAQFLVALDDPKELQMAYDLIRNFRK